MMDDSCTAGALVICWLVTELRSFEHPDWVAIYHTTFCDQLDFTRHCDLSGGYIPGPATTSIFSSFGHKAADLLSGIYELWGVS
jgi:hypothetical protein